jgi:hypothetical protein
VLCTEVGQIFLGGLDNRHFACGETEKVCNHRHFHAVKMHSVSAYHDHSPKQKADPYGSAFCFEL